jgi:hypothetical protein
VGSISVFGLQAKPILRANESFTTETQRSQRKTLFFFNAVERPAMKKQLASGN